MPLKSLKQLKTKSPNPRKKSRYNVPVGPKIKTPVKKQTGSAKKTKRPITVSSPKASLVNRDDDFTKGIDLSEISQWIAITAQVQDLIKGFVKSAPQPQPVIVVQGTTKDTAGQTPELIGNSSQAQTKQNVSVLNKIKSYFS